MKRFGNVLFMTVLSLIIIYMSVGATVMHCLRTDRQQIVAFVSENHVEHNCCDNVCGKNKAASIRGNCMQYMQVKLSPYSIIHNSHFDFAPNLFAVLPFFALTAKSEARHIINKNCKWKYIPHSPPRAFLAFIQVLLI